MKFQINEKKVTLPQEVHAYAQKKVSKLDRYFRDDAEAFVAFSVEKNRNKVELTVHASNMYFRASESTSDMYASIDAAVPTLNARSVRTRPVWPADSARTPLSAARRTPPPLSPTWKTPRTTSSSRSRNSP